ncbi:16S rRNA (guanine(966)-N(2))-methyltransferase RsmD [Gordonia sp. (in: high G+C Gram-positive bacteria)]|uniref:16S rRNA (guanine(966)-N(2))-methyltransferase RsmD n=1 Tax=Gordonia sp. (in: high G+C Gram-positive bacteria) TaxID=84139 RepID=UPI003C76B65F
MTRIIAGEFRGRRLAVPADTTRPTSDRVREALFSMLGSRMDLADLRVLDLFAGTGALGIEAVSRGAASAVLVEADRRAAGILRDNVSVCGAASRIRIVNRSVESFVGAPAGPFDLVFMDPPYEVSDDEVDGIVANVAAALAPEGWIVVERGRRSREVAWPDGLELVTSKQYGDTTVWVGNRI